MMSRTKMDIKNRKVIVEGLLKNDTDLLTNLKKPSNDLKVKSQFRTIAEQVSLYKSYNKDIIKICSQKVERSRGISQRIVRDVRYFKRNPMRV